MDAKKRVFFTKDLTVLRATWAKASCHFNFALAAVKLKNKYEEQKKKSFFKFLQRDSDFIFIVCKNFLIFC